MGDLRFQGHVLQQLARDTMTVDDVQLVVIDFDGTIERDEDGRTEYDRLMRDGRRLVVVVERDGITVVTASWDRRGGKRRMRRWN